jgi:hypothetical protein
MERLSEVDRHGRLLPNLDVTTADRSEVDGQHVARSQRNLNHPVV